MKSSKWLGLASVVLAVAGMAIDSLTEESRVREAVDDYFKEHNKSEEEEEDK